MKSKIFIQLSGLMIVLFCGGFLSCQKEQQPQAQQPPEERTVTDTEVPRAVLDAFHTNYPDAVVREYSEETEAGERYYEIAFEYAGARYDASYDAGGEVVELEKTIPAEALPAAIREALSLNYGELAIKQAEHVNKRGKIYYEVKLVEAGTGKRYELLYSEDGSLIESENDEE